MPIPEFQSFFHPFLNLAKDGKEHSLQEVRNFLTEFFSLTEDEKPPLRKVSRLSATKKSIK